MTKVEHQGETVPRFAVHVTLDDFKIVVDDFAALVREKNGGREPCLMCMSSALLTLAIRSALRHTSPTEAAQALRAAASRLDAHAARTEAEKKTSLVH